MCAAGGGVRGSGTGGGGGSGEEGGGCEGGGAAGNGGDGGGGSGGAIWPKTYTSARCSILLLPGRRISSACALPTHSTQMSQTLVVEQLPLLE